jgi:hypothetical protein
MCRRAQAQCRLRACINSTHILNWCTLALWHFGTWVLASLLYSLIGSIQPSLRSHKFDIEGTGKKSISPGLILSGGGTILPDYCWTCNSKVDLSFQELSWHEHHHAPAISSSKGWMWAEMWEMIFLNCILCLAWNKNMNGRSEQKRKSFEILFEGLSHWAWLWACWMKCPQTWTVCSERPYEHAHTCGVGGVVGKKSTMKLFFLGLFRVVSLQ